VTFLFTDLEGSTRRWEEHPEVMPGALARHDEILEQAITAHRGVVYSRMGDGMAAVFGSARDAVAAAVEAQQGLAGEQWPLPLGTLAARMGIHTGEGILVDGHYLNQPLNRCARLMAVAQGGQLVISGTTEPLVRGELGDGVALVDLGEHRLRDLDRPMHVFQVGGGTFAQLRSMSAFPGNLPLQVTSFVGRITELAAIQEALAQSRLVTLTGVGGVGKSRLALQVAADLLPRHRDGAWLVELGSVRDGAQVADAMATAFGLTVPSGAHAVDALVDLLRNKLLLVVVDNCEHLIGAAAELVSTLISSCDSVTVLATSREGLAVSGERIIAVPSLGAPSPHDPPDTVAASAAVRLFIDRAVAVDSAFRLSGANSEAVAEVCRRLDGIPLAIELAAARIPTISPAELAGRLDRRFRVLAGGRRGAVERHQTLRAAIDWSFDLLGPAEQTLLTRLSVFAGGCDLRACEEVCAGGVVEADDVLDLLAGLVARSLVVADHDGPVTRYRLLETIRQYGEERLDPTEADGLRAAHATYYAELAESAFRQAYGPEELLWRQRFAAEGENLVAAMNWAIDTDDADVGLQIGASVLSRFQGGYTVAIPVEPALGLGGAADHRLYPQALTRAAFEAGTNGDGALVELRCTQALEAEQRLGGPSAGMLEAWVSDARGNLEFTYGVFNAAAEHWQEAGEQAFAAGQKAFAALELASAANLRIGTDDDRDAVEAATHALDLARQFCGPATISLARGYLANALVGVDPERARALILESGSDQEEAVQGAAVAARLGDWPLTLQFTRSVIPVLHWQADRPLLLGMFNLSALALADDRPEVAAKLQGAARGIGRAWTAASAGHNESQAVALTSRGYMTDLRREASRRLVARLTEEQLARLRLEGEDMGLDQAVVYAVAQIDDVLTTTRSDGTNAGEAATETAVPRLR
jgi:predicted ATPase/class 3 adenylate cyclase